MPVQIPTEKWSGAVREVTLGATAAQGGTRTRTVTVGGETTLPFLHFEGNIPHAPTAALEIRSRRPADWSPLLLDAWGAVADDPAAWAKAAETAGAELITLTFSLEDSAADARKVLRQVLNATGLPLLVFGPGQAEKDNELIVAAAEEGEGERLVLGVCEDKNYRTIVAAALAHGHLVNSRTPMDVNLAKQLIILIRDMGLSLDRVLMDPSTGALGYGIEYGYSVMERLRIAALQGDSMTQQPMLVSPGEEAWKTKEAKVNAGVPATWGDWCERALHWETLTAMTLIHSGADVVVLRHPESLRRVQRAVGALMAQSHSEAALEGASSWR
jgi:acetyl-CoA decarbonylase/synthase, CODH/ACS complex subunit delta